YRLTNAAPSLGFDFQLLLASLGQAVVFGAAVVFGLSPKRGNPTFFFHAVQGRKERARLNHKSAAGDLLDSARDSESVHLASDQRFQDQQVQSSLQKSCGFSVQETSPIGVL